MDLSSLASQIASACSFALSPNASNAQRQEAYTFLQRVREASNETWQACLSLFLETDEGTGSSDGVGSGSGNDSASHNGYKWQADARMFGVQVVGESLPSLSPEALLYVQQQLFEYFQREYVISGRGEPNAAFLKNASIHLVTLLFVQLYPQASPNFISSFLNLLRLHSPNQSSSVPSPPPLNPRSTDLVLRLLHDISDEISDAQLRLGKSSNRLAKDSTLRDAVRERDAASIASCIWEIVNEALEGITSLSSTSSDDLIGLKGKRACEVLEMAMRVVGDYVSWIDINLMVTPNTIALLLRALHLPSTSDNITIRIAAADALLETVTKGMPPNDKLALLGVLDIGTVLGRLVEERDAERASTTTNGKAVANGVAGRPGEQDLDRFAEKGAKLLNGVGTELCKICEDASAPNDAKVAASNSTTSLFPLMLRLLADTHDESSAAVFPFIHALLSVYKKDKKRSAAANQGRAQVNPEREIFLTALLKASVAKMEYKPDVDWELSKEGEEDEEMLEFTELRKNLRQVCDAIASIDVPLYASAVQSIIVGTFDAFESGSRLTWQRLELALHLLYGFALAISVNGPNAFSEIPPTEIERSRRETDYKINHSNFPLSPLGEMMLRACRAKVVDFPHPAVALQFFEVAVRYSDFFKLCPEFIQSVLPSFLDEHGLHQSDETIQARVFYLFSRFIYQAKTIIQTQVSGEVISEILNRMQDLLSINVELSAGEATEEGLAKAASNPSFFDAQLYLFESIGTLISILNQLPQQQVALLRAVLSPLLNELQSHVRQSAATPEEYESVLRAHHLIMAAGNVAKGFPDASNKLLAASQAATSSKVNGTATTSGGSSNDSSTAMHRTLSIAWVEVFKEATESILVVTKTMASFVVIRDAARFAFNRIVATTGAAVLPLVPALIDCLLADMTFPELAELLSFVGLLVAKFKNLIVDILDTLLLPVFNRVFYFLKQSITGTDDVIQHSTLRRSYFNLILSIVGANLQQVFYSEKNKDSLSSILSSITHYIASPDAQAPDQRFGFILLNKLLLLWVVSPPTPNRTTSSNGVIVVSEESAVPGFEQFLYTSAIPVCFEVTLRRAYDLHDAQCVQVLGEISSLLKGLHQKRGDEFVEFMVQTYLPSTVGQWPPGAAEEILGFITSSNDGKQLKKPMFEWLRKMRTALLDSAASGHDK